MYKPSEGQKDKYNCPLNLECLRVQQEIKTSKPQGALSMCCTGRYTGDTVFYSISHVIFSFRIYYCYHIYHILF